MHQLSRKRLELKILIESKTKEMKLLHPFLIKLHARNLVPEIMVSVPMILCILSKFLIKLMFSKLKILTVDLDVRKFTEMLKLSNCGPMSSNWEKLAM